MIRRPKLGSKIWNRGERRRVLYVWRWPRRFVCHASIMPCQYIDDANDNRGRYGY